MPTRALPRSIVAGSALVCLSLLGLVPAGAQCPPADPEGVLKCFAIAHAEEDLAMYDALLAPDYVLRSGEEEASREMDLGMTRELFENASSIRVTFEDGYRIVPGGPGTWRIVDLVMRMRLGVDETPDKNWDVTAPIEYLEIVETPGVGCRIRAFVTAAQE